MKNAFKTTAIILFVLSTLLACKKKTDTQPEIVIDDQNLTECPQDASCSFQYANNAAMIDNNLTLTTGQYRVFWIRSQSNGRTYWLYMQAPMTGDQFMLTDADVQAGRIKYVSSCPSCFGIEFKAFNGTVKGIKVAKTNSTPERWLLEANIGLGVEGATQVASTLYVKQYFSLAVQ